MVVAGVTDVFLTLSGWHVLPKASNFKNRSVTPAATHYELESYPHPSPIQLYQIEWTLFVLAWRMYWLFLLFLSDLAFAFGFTLDVTSIFLRARVGGAYQMFGGTERCEVWLFSAKYCVSSSLIFAQGITSTETQECGSKNDWNESECVQIEEIDCGKAKLIGQKWYEGAAGPETVLASRFLDFSTKCNTIANLNHLKITAGIVSLYLERLFQHATTQAARGRHTERRFARECFACRPSPTRTAIVIVWSLVG